MTKFDVLDETGDHDSLREQIVDILLRVAPLAKTTTALDLPDRVVFRIVSVETARSAMTAHMAHLVRTYRELVPGWKRPFITLFSIPLLALFHRRSAVRTEFLVMGATHTVPETGESETQFVPDALEHTGILTDDKHLTSVVIHELVHQMQNAQSRNRANWTENKAMTLLHSGGINFVEEGHAYWADQAITKALYGNAVDVRSAPKSEEYKKHAGKGQKIDVHGVGLLLVESAINTVGTQKLNTVWNDHRLLPRRNEVAEAVTGIKADEPDQPKLWAARLERASFTEAGERSSFD
ncbi:hypothetical protein [Streptomyces sp. NPDC092903]|uniref:hypothetical protein n=1 Tax=Streptomyces sp. NPDC092903 TaxID=3366017 RepID=UPI0037F6359B